MDISPFVDDQGFRRANSQPRCIALDYFLEGDVQSSAYSCAQILKKIDAIKSGTLGRWESTGNAHTLILTADCAFIENEYSTDTMTTLSLDEFLHIITKWRDFACAKESEST